MPEYLAPGVFVEETSFRSKSIEGVSTTTTGFIGPTRYGPIALENELITSLGEFERTYGSRLQLTFGGDKLHNYMWHAVRAFFEEGGKRLYISRVFRQTGGEYEPNKLDITKEPNGEPSADGHARESVRAAPAIKPAEGLTEGRPAEGPTEGRPAEGSTEGKPAEGTTTPVTLTARPGRAGRLMRTAAAEANRTAATEGGATSLLLVARYPGASGNMGVRLTLRVGQNILSYKGNEVLGVGALLDKDVVLINWAETEGAGDFYSAHLEPNGDWTFRPLAAAGTALNLRDLTPSMPPAPAPKPEGGEPKPVEGGAKPAEGAAKPAVGPTKREIHVITATVTLFPTAESDTSLVWDGLALDPEHTRSGAKDSLSARFEYDPLTPSRNREIPLIIGSGKAAVKDGLALLSILLGAKAELGDSLRRSGSSDAERSIEVLLKGGNDGDRPTADDYTGKNVPDTTRKTGLKQFEDLEDISIVAAPGSTFGYENGYGTDASTIVNSLISHCERMKYRIAVLDSGNHQTLQQVRAMRAKLDSSHAALYYPWVKVLDPVTRQTITLPPSGFVAGIYARNDVQRAVYKAPANEVVTSALGFESILNTAQQEAINPEGINAFRFFEGRGFRLWGARTVSSDPEWKYVNLRRYFAYLERSIDKGTQWAVFEPNGPQLWSNVRRTIEDFLLNEWQSGALLGDRPDAAYFVKCDRSTMTQNDLDNGRLVCLVGVAPLRPAEFVIIRIGQWTGDRK